MRTEFDADPVLARALAADPAVPWSSSVHALDLFAAWPTWNWNDNTEDVANISQAVADHQPPAVAVTVSRSDAPLDVRYSARHTVVCADSDGDGDLDLKVEFPVMVNFAPDDLIV